jgi:FKBP-type peptidyl-prolyl cis-trans isomerase 2
MSAAKTGDTVKVHYTGILEDGTQFDSSRGSEPLQFTLGGGRILPGFEIAVEGMIVGGTKTIYLPAEDAYGPYREDLTQEVPRSVIPDDIELAEGIILHAQGPDGQTLHFTVVNFDDQKVKIDGNHPLAGKDLTFELELMELV